MNIETIRTWGLGFWIAFVVFVICIVLLVVGKPLTTEMAICLIAALALARML